MKSKGEQLLMRDHLSAIADRASLSFELMRCCAARLLLRRVNKPLLHSVRGVYCIYWTHFNNNRAAQQRIILLRGRLQPKAEWSRFSTNEQPKRDHTHQKDLQQDH